MIISVILKHCWLLPCRAKFVAQLAIENASKAREVRKKSEQNPEFVVFTFCTKRTTWQCTHAVHNLLWKNTLSFGLSPLIFCIAMLNHLIAVVIAVAACWSTLSTRYTIHLALHFLFEFSTDFNCYFDCLKVWIYAAYFHLHCIRRRRDIRCGSLFNHIYDFSATHKLHFPCATLTVLPIRVSVSMDCVQHIWRRNAVKLRTHTNNCEESWCWSSCAQLWFPKERCPCGSNLKTQSTTSNNSFKKNWISHCALLCVWLFQWILQRRLCIIQANHIKCISHTVDEWAAVVWKWSTRMHIGVSPTGLLSPRELLLNHTLYVSSCTQAS